MPPSYRASYILHTLADRYIGEGIISIRYRSDALHTVVAVVYGTEVIVS
jgi:hypothetical protein